MTILFTGGAGMANEFYSMLHPEVRGVVSVLADKLGRDIRVTEVCRSDEESERIYMVVAQRLLTSNPLKLHGVDKAQWEQIQVMSPQGVRNWARMRPTWHKAWAAVDVSLTGWSPGDLATMAEEVAVRCHKPMWEVIMEPHGTGPHLHLARRDYVWLKDFPGSLRSARGRKEKSPPSR